jgi:hypothetical protein
MEYTIPNELRIGRNYGMTDETRNAFFAQRAAYHGDLARLHAERCSQHVTCHACGGLVPGDEAMKDAHAKLAYTETRVAAHFANRVLESQYLEAQG